MATFAKYVVVITAVTVVTAAVGLTVLNWGGSRLPHESAITDREQWQLQGPVIPKPPPPQRAPASGAGGSASNDNDLDSLRQHKRAERPTPPPPPPPPTLPPQTTPTVPPVPQVTVSYNAPLEIPYEQATDYRVVISLTPGPSSSDFDKVKGPILHHQIEYAQHMKAFLKASDSSVTTEDMGAAPCQPLAADSEPTWDWSVTPTTTKPFELYVTIWEVGPNCNDPAPMSDRIDTFKIKVHASVWQNIVIAATETYPVLTALIALITAAGGAVAAWHFKKSKKASAT